ncbi:hypothetical protein FMEAI12_4640044 [Parafrankia sp. Ea1.12]|nr:hypothetical protein FMEAI12_4640044 [Parafrankia sp. Ea1.12]
MYQGRTRPLPGPHGGLQTSLKRSFLEVFGCIRAS